jgi:hypothetical protein
VEEKGERRRKTEFEKAASILEYSFIILNPLNK